VSFNGGRLIVMTGLPRSADFCEPDEMSIAAF
jgi:hypothetical protein